MGDRGTARAALWLAVWATLLAGCGEGSGPPIEFSPIAVEDITGASAAVRFTTNVETSCEIHFGTSSAQLDQVAVDPDMEPGERDVDHDVIVEDLSPATTYFFRAVATDKYGDTAESSLQQFTTIDPNDPTSLMTNVALRSGGATIEEVSSNWSNAENDSIYGVNKAFDGMMSTEWSSAGDGDDAYVVVGFGGEQLIGYFGYRSRKMNDGSSIVEKVQFVVDDETVYGPFDTPDPDTRYTFPIDPPVATTAVRVEAVQTTGGNTGAKEIQFYVSE